MALTTKITSYFLLLIFPFGQLLRSKIFNFSFPVIDIFIIILAIFNLIHQKPLKIHNRPLFFFLIYSFFSLILNHFLSSYPPIKPFFYYLRLAALLSFFVFGKSTIIFSKTFSRLLDLVIISNIVFGIIQYLFWPNLTYFDSLNWDPHLNRLVSSFLDPTFTGLLYLLFLIFLFLNYRLQITDYKLLIPYLALALTYSRSSLLAFIASFAYISIKKKQAKIFIGAIVITAITVFLLPRPPGEGTKLERTNSFYAKIENYRQGINLFLKSPLIGHGYNHLSYIQNIDSNSHAASGLDSSLLTILVTHGIIGFSLFIGGLMIIFRNSNILSQSLFIAILTHSFFSNSLLYPWVLFLFLSKYHRLSPPSSLSRSPPHHSL